VLPCSQESALKYFYSRKHYHIVSLCVSLLFTSTLVRYLQGRQELTKEEPRTGFQSNGRLLALLENIRLGWKLMAVVFTLAYYDVPKIVTATSVIVLAQVSCFHLQFLQAGKPRTSSLAYLASSSNEKSFIISNFSLFIAHYFTKFNKPYLMLYCLA
jgi:hypothetical protein